MAPHEFQDTPDMDDFQCKLKHTQRFLFQTDEIEKREMNSVVFALVVSLICNVIQSLISLWNCYKAEMRYQCQECNSRNNFMELQSPHSVV